MMAQKCIAYMDNLDLVSHGDTCTQDYQHNIFTKAAARQLTFTPMMVLMKGLKYFAYMVDLDLQFIGPQKSINLLSNKIHEPMS